MTDGQLVLLILVAFACYESARWVPARAWLWQSDGRHGWRVSRPWKVLQARGGAVAPLPPVPPAGAHVVLAGWPCAPHEQGLCVWDEQGGNAIHIPWDTVKPVADGAMLRLTREVSTRCIHATSASTWAAEVRKWIPMPQAEREASFRVFVATHLMDGKTLDAAATHLVSMTRAMRRLGDVICCWTFLVIPFVYWRFGDAWPTLAVTGTLLALMLTQTVLLVRQVRRHPALRKDAVAHALGVALLPAPSMRAGDWVCATLSPEALPLVGLQLWGTREALEKAAAEVWRKARWPAGDFSERPWNGPEVKVLREFLEKAELDISSLESPPTAQSGCTLWCPRCQVQYGPPAVECSDCTGVKLLEFRA